MSTPSTVLKITKLYGLNEFSEDIRPANDTQVESGYAILLKLRLAKTDAKLAAGQTDISEQEQTDWLLSNIGDESISSTGPNTYQNTSSDDTPIP